MKKSLRAGKEVSGKEKHAESPLILPVEPEKKEGREAQEQDTQMTSFEHVGKKDAD